MKISNIIRLAGVALFTITVAACSSSTTATARDMGGDLGGAALSALAYSPNGGGFPYKSTYVNPAEFNSWATKYKSQIETALSALPIGYKLQITGHTDSTGPRDGDGMRKGNIWYSTERAKAVHDALIAQGIPKDKITYRGIANDEPLPAIASNDQMNRRVSFKVVKQ
ncbi:MAG: OmpA family protein [Spirochaetia bacterium]|nr:OmpA family protein [Spirochaetia bacterium]